MLVVLLGPSCSGKSTFQKELVEDEGYYAVRTATTRPKRVGEDLSSYYFLKDRAFAEWEARGDLLCVETFRGWRYGVPRDELVRSTSKTNRVVILTVGGVLELLARHAGIVMGDALSILYLGVDGVTAEHRAYRRGDERREYLRRMAADSIDFRHFPKENGVWEFTPDYIVDCINNPQNWKLKPRLNKLERKHS
jgi:guanylate kinase|nr:MAG TPA: GMPK protein [Caudoviricetes sp.]